MDWALLASAVCGGILIAGAVFFAVFIVGDIVDELRGKRG